MEIQSLSITVPTGNHCVNNCPFCVSKTHTNPYDDRISECINVIKSYEGELRRTLDPVEMNTTPSMFSRLEYIDYFNRLQYARDNGCNVVVLTGTGEPLQNMTFIRFFHFINSKITTPSPFKSIELQTTGVFLNEKVLLELRQLGITTISFSISDIFDNENNLKIIGCAKSLRFDLKEVIALTRKFGFNIRLSLNLLNTFDDKTMDEVLSRCEELDADQITFRRLYSTESDTKIDDWIRRNKSFEFEKEIDIVLNHRGYKYLGKLPFGAKMFDINGMSVVLDDNCMTTEIDEKVETYKYLILRENCKLYTRWETKASLVF